MSANECNCRPSPRLQPEVVARESASRSGQSMMDLLPDQHACGNRPRRSSCGHGRPSLGAHSETKLSLTKTSQVVIRVHWPRRTLERIRKMLNLHRAYCLAAAYRGIKLDLQLGRVQRSNCTIPSSYLLVRLWLVGRIAGLALQPHAGREQLSGWAGESGGGSRACLAGVASLSADP